MIFDQIKKIADAVLYEGYVLYPYRASAIKNQRRFNFGVLVPVGSEQIGDVSEMRTEVLIEGSSPILNVRVRFLHLVSREVYRKIDEDEEVIEGATPAYERVAELRVGERHFAAWHEAVEREVVVDKLKVREMLDEPNNVMFEFGEDETSVPIIDETGVIAGQLRRCQFPVQGTVVISAESLEPELTKVSVVIRNQSSKHAQERSEAIEAGLRLRNETPDPQLQCCVSTHTILTLDSGSFISLFDPPLERADQVTRCQNTGAWPVLVGEANRRNAMLSSPIILYDFPEIAAESQGDFCDGTEIDEMLTLRVWTLTDAEKAEMQQLDPRAREILERTESLPLEQMQKLHGAVRGLRAVRRH